MVSLAKVNKQTAAEIRFCSKSNFTSAMRWSYIFSLFGLYPTEGGQAVSEIDSWQFPLIITRESRV